MTHYAQNNKSTLTGISLETFSSLTRNKSIR